MVSYTVFVLSLYVRLLFCRCLGKVLTVAFPGYVYLYVCFIIDEVGFCCFVNSMLITSSRFALFCFLYTYKPKQLVEGLCLTSVDNDQLNPGALFCSDFQFVVDRNFFFFIYLFFFIFFFFLFYFFFFFHVVHVGVEKRVYMYFSVDPLISNGRLHRPNSYINWICIRIKCECWIALQQCFRGIYVHSVEITLSVLFPF